MESVLDKLASASEAYNPIFQDLSRPIADVLGLENLGPHFDVFVYSFVLFNLASIVLVPGLSRLFFKRVYGALDGKARNKWYVTLSLHFRKHWRANAFRLRKLINTECCRYSATTPHAAQELPWRINDSRIDRGPLGHPVPRLSRLVCGSRVRLG